MDARDAGFDSDQAVPDAEAAVFVLDATSVVALIAALATEQFVFAADPDLRLRDFSIGLVDSSNLIYFLSITGVCLIAATRALAARRLK